MEAFFSIFGRDARITGASVRFMGGGPRTFPGGVTKWQWKRMQEKKKKERDRIWLSKERSLYERRRRAQIMALMPLRPWEKIHPEAPSLPKIDKDPKIKEMAHRFQTCRGVDLWTKNDGPETCRELRELDQDGSAPELPVLKAFRPLALSTSQRISDLSKSQQVAMAQKQEQQRQDEEQRESRIKKTFYSRRHDDPPEGDEVFQHSRFMLASYLRKQGHMGLGYAAETTGITKDSSTSSGDSDNTIERSDYSSWLSALANDRQRLAERQESVAAGKRSGQQHRPGQVATDGDKH
ncbi:hypothetical protein SELMODRAFT_406229 [Selaginella moellendorffii]|uniref:Uncharacterized protein n=1 Tax=Selaginella moellendorffii TaxID=88036 RepID=D8R1P6_SELML|nr:hypothetical protein SELMODRAFT_406229 [Selaginella moellendorffii]